MKKSSRPAKIAAKYFDYNSTTPLDPRVKKTMLPYFTESFYNPSARYRAAEKSRHAVDIARRQVAGLIHADPARIFFTSGGSESDSLAILGTARRLQDRGDHVIVSAIEHQAVLQAARYLRTKGFAVTYLPVDRRGVVDPDDLRKSLKPATILVSVMLANNEIGSLQPVHELARIAHDGGSLFHTDAVQAGGKIKIDCTGLGIDLLSLSSHKIYGPKGAGALWIREGVKIEPLIFGGGQEREIRAGTENVPAIVGFGMSCELAQREMDEESASLTRLRDRLQRGIMETIPGASINGDVAERLPNTISVCFAGVRSEELVVWLDRFGFCLSSAAACSARSGRPSHVLLALGKTEKEAESGVRISIGRFTEAEECEQLLSLLGEAVADLRGPSPFGASRSL